MLHCYVYSPITIDQGHIVLPLSICLSQNKSRKNNISFLSFTLFEVQDSFLGPLFKGQGGIVMVLCLSSVCPSVCPFVRACISKLCLQKTSPQKLFTGFLLNFTRMFLRWSFFKFRQIIVFHEEFWLPWQPK